MILIICPSEMVSDTALMAHVSPAE
jgi:hypothetical protein